MLWKCYTQYASKFGKLSSCHRTGKVQFSCQSQRRARPKNVQTTIHLYSFHMLARLCWTSFKLGFTSTWTENFQIYMLDLEKAEEPEIKCQHMLDHRKCKGIPKIHLFLLYWLCQSLWLCGSPQTVENSERDGNNRPLDLTLEKSCMQIKKQQLELDME